MKVIKFKQEFLEPILTGVKTQTMRIPQKRIDVKPDERVLAIFPNGEEIVLRITGWGYKAFKSISDEDAKREGYVNADELKEALLEIYNDYRIEDYNRFYYYKFEVVYKR